MDFCPVCDGPLDVESKEQEVRIGTRTVRSRTSSHTVTDVKKRTILRARWTRRCGGLRKPYAARRGS